MNMCNLTLFCHFRHSYDLFLLDYYRGDHYDRFLQEYYEYSGLKRHIFVIQINDIYLATQCERSGLEEVIEVSLRTYDTKILTQMDAFLVNDRRIISHQPENGFVSYSKELDEWLLNLLSRVDNQCKFVVEDATLQGTVK